MFGESSLGMAVRRWGMTLGKLLRDQVERMWAFRSAWILKRDRDRKRQEEWRERGEGERGS